MSERPILFSSPMIRALLAGTKTQTRRMIKLPAWATSVDYDAFHGWRFNSVDHFEPLRLRLEVGDRLWVREAFLPDPSADPDEWDDWTCSYTEWSSTGCKASQVPPALRSERNVIFQADQKWDDVSLRFTIGRFMPRWASRITLTVTDVRVQRLWEISEEDALAEGVSVDKNLPEHVHRCWLDLGNNFAGAEWLTGWNARDVYSQLWHVINGPGSWEANPWVAAYTFTVQLGNIDQIGAAA